MSPTRMFTVRNDARTMEWNIKLEASLKNVVFCIVLWKPAPCACFAVKYCKLIVLGSPPHLRSKQGQFAFSQILWKETLRNLEGCAIKKLKKKNHLSNGKVELCVWL